MHIDIHRYRHTYIIKLNLKCVNFNLKCINANNDFSMRCRLIAEYINMNIVYSLNILLGTYIRISICINKTYTLLLHTFDLMERFLTHMIARIANGRMPTQCHVHTSTSSMDTHTLNPSPRILVIYIHMQSLHGTVCYSRTPNGGSAHHVR